VTRYAALSQTLTVIAGHDQQRVGPQAECAQGRQKLPDPGIHLAHLAVVERLDGGPVHGRAHPLPAGAVVERNRGASSVRTAIVAQPSRRVGRERERRVGLVVVDPSEEGPITAPAQPLARELVHFRPIAHIREDCRGVAHGLEAAVEPALREHRLQCHEGRGLVAGVAQQRRERGDPRRQRLGIAANPVSPRPQAGEHARVGRPCRGHRRGGALEDRRPFRQTIEMGSQPPAAAVGADPIDTDGVDRDEHEVRRPR
jgi:hypothetical protein